MVPFDWSPVYSRDDSETVGRKKLGEATALFVNLPDVFNNALRESHETLFACASGSTHLKNRDTVLHLLRSQDSRLGRLELCDATAGFGKSFYLDAD